MHEKLSRHKNVVRVIPDVDAVTGEYDYTVPESWFEDNRAHEIQVGSIVRFRFRNRLIRGWVSEINPLDQSDRELLSLTKLSGVGPPTEVMDLARWAAHQWQGPLPRFLRIASPKTMMRLTLPRVGSVQKELSLQNAGDNNGNFKSTVVRIPPIGDRWPHIQEVVKSGNALILVPSIYQATLLVGRLKRMGISAGLHGKDWLIGAHGGTIVGTRSAAFAPVQDLASIIMIDEHDRVYENEATPTWHARDIVHERAKRLGIPVLFTSPIPTPEVRELSNLQIVGRNEQKRGWGNITVIDPREDGTSYGGIWPRNTLEAIKSSNRAVIVLNRKGRSKMLACASCDELVTCAICGSGMTQPQKGKLVCSKSNHERPVTCTHCLSTRLKNLRIGISRAVEELETLLHEKVHEIEAGTKETDFESNRVFLGTNAVLHRIDWADLVVFADFDQDLFSTSYRSEERALDSIVRAVRITNIPGGTTGKIYLQTRSTGNSLIETIQTANIDEWAESESARRKLLDLPPYGSFAAISGSGAEQYVRNIQNSNKLEVLGPQAGTWMVKCKDHEILLRSLEKTPKPKARLRIAVNPSDP
ncbi:MAG: hypothetical protein VYD77_00040 [Actinomycetota bacterium]|nr:hypothetical protein [Actinomycetota bacterium]